LVDKLESSLGKKGVETLPLAAAIMQRKPVLWKAREGREN